MGEQTKADKLVSEGDGFFREGAYLKAAGAYMKASKLDPSNAELQCNLSYALLKEHKFHKALDAATAALTLDETNPKAWFRKGLALVALERWEEGVTCLTEVLERQPAHENKEVSDMLALAKWRCKQNCLKKETEVPESCKDAKEPPTAKEEREKREKREKAEAAGEEPEKELTREELVKKMEAIKTANESKRVRKHNKKVMGKLAAEVVAEKELVTKDMLTQAKAALEADQKIRERIPELVTDEGFKSTKTNMTSGDLLEYTSERVTRFSQVELEGLTKEGDRASFKDPVAIVLPGVHREGWGDEGQGLNLLAAFDTKLQWQNTNKFLRKFVEDSKAHAVMMVTPKARVVYPAVLESKERAAQCEGEGYLLHLEAKQKADRAVWWVRTDGSNGAGVAHQLENVDDFGMINFVFQESVPTKDKKKGNKKKR